MIQETSTIRLGIIGFGNIARQHFKAAQSSPRLSVKAVADPFLSNDNLLNGSVQIFHQWEDLLNHAEIDAVSICVPHNLHFPIASAALDAGKHVLVEKPLALNVHEAGSLIDIAEQNHRALMVELTHRFYPAMREAIAFVNQGNLGEIFAVEDRIVESVGEQIKPWLKSKTLAGGGVALTNGIHMVDRIGAITGQELRFVAGNAGYSLGLGDIEDTAAMLFELENGAPVQVLASWTPGSRSSDDELTVYGTQGTLRVWAWRGWRFEPSDGRQATERFCHAPEEKGEVRIQAGVAAALEEFASAINDRRAPSPSPEVALVAQELIEQFYQFVGAQVSY